MVFFVNVAADIYGHKHNGRLEFPSCPTLTELINAVESQYDIESRANRPSGYPDIPFRVQSFQVYDDILLRWVDLYSSAQLSSGCQCYCFQPETVWNVDVQGAIPIPKSVVTWTSPAGSPGRSRLSTDSGIPPSMSEKLRSVFFDLDIGNKGYILYSDMRAVFRRLDIEFAYTTVGELFHEADRSNDGHVGYEKWVRFAIDHPNIVDALFFRSRDLQYKHHVPLLPPAGGGSAALELSSHRRLRELELERLCSESKAERARAQLAYEEAKRDAELARQRALTAADRERAALDRLCYAPASPSRLRY